MKQIMQLWDEANAEDRADFIKHIIQRYNSLLCKEMYFENRCAIVKKLEIEGFKYETTTKAS